MPQSIRQDVIVFEYLEMQGKISGKKKQKLHLWRKRDIQKLCEHQAHRIRNSCVQSQCPEHQQAGL